MLGRKELQAFKQMKEALIPAVVQEASQIINDNINKQQKTVNKHMEDKLAQWDDMVRARVIDLIDQELVPKIQKLIKVELNTQ